MGSGTGVSIQLVEALPDRLRYLLTTTGTGGPNSVLPNANAATPDLRTDARTQPATPGSGRNFLLEIVSTPAANQAAARRLLLGDFAGQPVAETYEPHCHCRITPRHAADPDDIREFNLDANEGAAAGSAGSAGFAVLVINTPAAMPAGVTAYLDVFAQHSKYH